MAQATEVTPSKSRKPAIKRGFSMHCRRAKSHPILPITGERLNAKFFAGRVCGVLQGNKQRHVQMCFLCERNFRRQPCWRSQNPGNFWSGRNDDNSWQVRRTARYRGGVSLLFNLMPEMRPDGFFPQQSDRRMAKTEGREKWLIRTCLLYTSRCV